MGKRRAGTNSKEEGFNAAVKKVVDELNHPTLTYVPGSDILTDFSGLSGDLLHPTPYGHAIMGQNLAEVLKRVVPGLA